MIKAIFSNQYKYCAITLFLIPTITIGQSINVNSYINFSIADSLYDRGEYKKSIEYFNKGLKKNVNHNIVYYKLAICYKNCGLYGNATTTIIKGINNGMYYLDTLTVNTDTNLLACFRGASDKLIKSSYNKIYLNCLTHSQKYNQAVKFKEDSLELIKRRELDQKYRNENNINDSLWRLQKQIDLSNELYLKSILKKMNWPGILQVGMESEVSAFLIVQHSDNIKFQMKCLKRMGNELKNKNISLPNYAYLYDRIQINFKNKQLFGTQVEYVVINGKETAMPKPMLCPNYVNVLRNYFQLSSIEDYITYMNSLLQKK